jgi:hypothetical protein
MDKKDGRKKERWIKRETRKIEIIMEKGKKNDGDKNGVGKKERWRK